MYKLVLPIFSGLHKHSRLGDVQLSDCGDCLESLTPTIFCSLVSCASHRLAILDPDLRSTLIYLPNRYALCHRRYLRLSGGTSWIWFDLGLSHAGCVVA